jgi:cellulose synthase/poly-beta-1,6-N-acetylglucosamine synthase-like glycosyltransferase
MTSLISQKYPPELFEIIVADDDSTDNTANLIESFCDRGIEVTYLLVKGRERVVSPKKHALEQAIKASSGEIILTTDADCVVPLNWIQTMVEAFADGVTMVAGYSRTRIPDWGSAPVLQKYEHLDFALTYMVLGGGYTIGRSWACIGQNLAYTRSAFDAVGGFASIRNLISGDDVNLMQLMRRSGHRIIFNFDPRSFVSTNPVRSWKQLLNQRSRWASNMKYQLKFNPEFFFILLSMAFMYWGAPLMFFFSWKLALIFLAARVFIELTLISYARAKFDVTLRMLRFYPLWLVIQTFFLVFTMVLGQFNLFVWHGKKPPKRKKHADL